MSDCVSMGQTSGHRVKTTADLAVVCGWAAERGIELGGLEVRRRSLEDVYLELVGEGVDVNSFSSELLSIVGRGGSSEHQGDE